MDAIRRIVTVKDIFLQVLLPETYRNKQVEVIILPTDEVLENPVKTEKFDFTQLYGKLNSGMTINEIDEKIKKMRGEWDRLPD